MRRLALLVLFAACQPGLERSVQSLSAAGSFVDSTELLLRAHETGDPKAAELLPAAAQDAYRAEIDRAEQAEAEDDLAGSLAAYDRVILLSKRVVAAGGPALPDHIAAERAEIARATATLFAARASVAYDDGRYQEALSGWRLAESTDAEATDSELQVPLALARLGDEARTAHRYREAIGLYDESVALGGGDVPRMWSAAIHAGLGRHALKNGACRKAVAELTEATALPFDVKLAGDLERARTCATSEVVVQPFEDLVEGGIQRDNLGVLLVDQLGHHLISHGSRFLVLLDPSSRGARGEGGPGGRFEVQGHLTRVDIVPAAQTETQQTGTGTLKVPCEVGGEPTCEETVTVTYTLLEETLHVDIAGAIKLVDRQSGEQVTTKPLDIRVNKVRREARDPKVTDVRGYVLKAQVGTKATDRVVGLTGEARTDFAKPQPMPDAARVVDEAVVRLAASAADAVLTAIDQPDDLADPRTLILVTPVASAEDISFGAAEIEEEEAPAPIAVEDGAEETAPVPETP